jgi:hypothetical protein
VGLTVLVVAFVVGDVYMSGMYPLRLVRVAVRCSSSSSGDVRHQLGCLVSRSVGKDGSVRGVELAEYLPAELIAGIDTYHGHDYSGQVTIRELMSMTSGIPDYYDKKGKDGKTRCGARTIGPTAGWSPRPPT